MEALTSFALVLAVVLQPILFLALGRAVESGLEWCEARLFPSEAGAVDGWGRAHCILTGLIIYLLFTFLLRMCSVPWPMAALLPYLLSLSHLPRAVADLRAFRPSADINALLWFFIVLVFGSSLFQATDSISTRWVNNYGDLTFHLGMITSFVLGENTLPEYHLYPGVRLSYPFLVNLWSASLWWIAPRIAAPRFDLLALIFTYQWVLLWCLVYHFLRGSRYYILPWALLFGGGSYLALGENSGQLIDKGVPWSSFLTTIWVTQRSALFGIVVVTAVCLFFFRGLNSSRVALRAGLLLALSPLIHVHAVLTAILFCGVLLVFRVLEDFCRSKPWQESALRVAVFSAALIPSALFLPWLIGKSGIASFVLGWMPGNNATGFERLADSIRIWGIGAWPMFLVFALFWIFSRAHAQCCVWVLLFLFFNFVKLAVWEWDQLKIFIALYVIMLAMWAQQERRIFIYLQIPALVLLVASIYEVIPGIKRDRGHEIYNAEAIAQAADIVKVTEPTAIIAGKPDHNSLLTLTGRRIYLGYLGTLSSHNIEYKDREDLFNDFSKLIHCNDQDRVRPCPDYLLWTANEQQFWRGARPGSVLEPTTLPYLFRVPKGK